MSCAQKTRCSESNCTLSSNKMSVFAQMKRATLYSDIIRFALERCNPSPHVANRHISICQLLSLRCQCHYDVIRELSSSRLVQSASWQSASWRIRELSSYRASYAYGARSPCSHYDVILIMTSFATELATPSVTNVRTPYRV